MHGKGVYCWKSGHKFEGSFENTLISGWGCFTLHDVKYYECSFSGASLESIQNIAKEQHLHFLIL